MKKLLVSALIAALMLVPEVACAATSTPEPSTHASVKHEPNARSFICRLFGVC